MPYCRANSTAACQSESGNFTRPDWLLRKSSNWRCNCKIGSGVVDVDLRFTISRLRRLTQLIKPGPRPSRMATGNSLRRATSTSVDTGFRNGILAHRNMAVLAPKSNAIKREERTAHAKNDPE